MTAKFTAYRILKFAGVAYLLTYLATCEAVPLPNATFCSQERAFIDSHEALRRVIAGKGMNRRQSLFPGTPERTPEEVYAANPGAWEIRRTLLGYSSAWAVTAMERVADVDRPGTWEGVFKANVCADEIEEAWMVNYD